MLKLHDTGNLLINVLAILKFYVIFVFQMNWHGYFLEQHIMQLNLFNMNTKGIELSVSIL